MKCPRCRKELRRSKKDPNYGLCDNCRKKYKWIEDNFEDDYEEDEDYDYIESKSSKRKKKKKKGKGMIIVFAVILIVLIIIGILAFLAKGSDKDKKGEKQENQNEQQNSPEDAEVPDSEATAYFQDDILKIEMATIKLTGFEVAPPNQEFGEEKSTLIITYDFTNDSDDVIQPSTAWIACFDATQETETTIDSLNVAMSPQDEKYTEMNNLSLTDVKPGATVQSVISYEINDTTKPITLKATQGVGGRELGEKIYNLQ